LPDSRFETGPNRDAAWAVLEEMTRRLAEGTPGYSTAEVCARFGIEAEAVRRRMAEMVEMAEAQRDEPR